MSLCDLAGETRGAQRETPGLSGVRCGLGGNSKMVGLEGRVSSSLLEKLLERLFSPPPLSASLVPELPGLDLPDADLHPHRGLCR